MVSRISPISRRQALKAGLAAGALIPLTARVDGSTTDARVTTTTASGTVYAQHSPGGPLLPLFGIATVSRVRACGVLRRISVFTDLGCGGPIEIFKNPFNGHFCKVVVPVEEIHEAVATQAFDTAARGTRRTRLPWYPWLLMQDSPGGLIVEESGDSARSWRDASFDQSVWNHIESIARL